MLLWRNIPARLAASSTMVRILEDIVTKMKRYCASKFEGSKERLDDVTDV